VLGHDSVPFAGTYTGVKAVKDYFKGFFGSIRIKDFDFQYKISQDNIINSHFRMVAYVFKTRKTFDLEFVYSFELVGKKIEKLSIYYDTYALTTAFTAGGENLVSDLKGTDTNDVVPVTFNSTAIAQSVYYNLYVAQDLYAVLAVMDPAAQIVFKSPEGIIPFAGIYHGVPGFVQFVTNLMSSVGPFNIEYKAFISEGNRVDVLIHEDTFVYSTGKIFNIEVLHSFRFNDSGLITSFKSYNDSKDMVDKFQ
jgi:hypothetical protein